MTGLLVPACFSALEDAARHRTDIGSAMAANLGLVAHAAERDANELSPHRSCDRTTERGLADPGRPREAEDWTP